MIAADATTLRVSRVLPARRAAVYAALTDAGLIRRWMCPQDFAVLHAEAEARPGGRLRVEMRGPDGGTYAASGRFIELRPPELVAFTWTWESENPMAGIETRIRIELTEHDGGTLIVMIHSGLPDAAQVDSHRKGWTSVLANLDHLMQQGSVR